MVLRSDSLKLFVVATYTHTHTHLTGFHMTYTPPSVTLGCTVTPVGGSGRETASSPEEPPSGCPEG